MQLPTRLGKYELVEFLGGGMSHVFRATDTVIGRTVAVKILTPEGCADSETKDRFLQEARMARDINPDNLQVTSKGVVKLMDFGIAKLEDLSRTRPGFVLGTPYYMAPEQVRGQKVTPLVDVYAFGVVLFELMSGVKPFKADTVE